MIGKIFSFFPNGLSVSMWAAQLFYFLCLIPQIVTNFRCKSGSGISDLLLILYLNSYLCLFFYIFCLKLPVAYQILVPIQGLATGVLIAQRLYYEPIKKLIFLYAINIAIFLPAVPFALKHPQAIGSAFGWLSFAFILFNQLPQVVKLYQAKSVAGFSFLFVIFAGLAACIETVAAFAVPLPRQTQSTAMRGVLMALIFCWQFVVYKK